jgi:putative transcriptional regulator
VIYLISVKELREQTGLSQSEFAAKYDLNLRSLQNWEQGVSMPPRYVVTLLSRVVGLDYKIEESESSNE